MACAGAVASSSSGCDDAICHILVPVCAKGFTIAYVSGMCIIALMGAKVIL